MSLHVNLFNFFLIKGQVLIFLDANTECTDGWLEPILSRIASDRSVVVTPRIDNINITTISYEKYNDSAVYGLGWDLGIHLYVSSIGINITHIVSITIKSEKFIV